MSLHLGRLFIVYDRRLLRIGWDVDEFGAHFVEWYVQ